MKATLNLENDYGFVLDMDISDKANPDVKVYDFEGNLISGGGGGGGDFETATLIIDNINGSTQINATINACIYDASTDWGLPEGTLPMTIGQIYPDVDRHETATIENIVVYKGHSLVCFSALDNNVTLSGNIVLVDGDSNLYDISGNATITNSN